MIWNGDIGNVTEVHAWSDRPMWPQGITQIPKEEPVPATLDWDLWSGVAEKRPFVAAAAQPARAGGFLMSRSVGAASSISAADRWATWRATFWVRSTWP